MRRSEDNQRAWGCRCSTEAPDSSRALSQHDKDKRTQARLFGPYKQGVSGPASLFYFHCLSLFISQNGECLVLHNCDHASIASLTPTKLQASAQVISNSGHEEMIVCAWILGPIDSCCRPMRSFS